MAKHPLSLARRQKKRLDAFRAMDDIRAVTIKKEDVYTRAVSELAPALLRAIERCEHRIKLLTAKSAEMLDGPARRSDDLVRPPCYCDDCTAARKMLEVHARAISAVLAEQDRVMAAYAEKKR